MSTVEAPTPTNFIESIIDEDLASGKHQTVVTRFPPEPNGYLHIGHAKAICLNFGLAKKYQGRCHMRFDDTNPVKEETEYVESILNDVKWLGFEWGDHLYYCSDYFEQFYQFAEHLIQTGRAYVDDLTAEEIRAHRGTLTQPGQPSPYRDRPAEENLDLFRRMRAGEFEDGARVLRAKIDMASPNLNMRDPTLYRIRRAHHHRTGDAWCIYPMYDYSHPINDALEGITHSICTLEFENHRPLYDWTLDNIPAPCHPQQIEFARLNLTHTVMSKRKLLELVKTGIVRGWDDPRMPTIAALRRRGIPPEAIRAFCDTIGVGKSDAWIDPSILEEAIRNELNPRAPRVMGVLRPLKMVIANWPEGQTEEVEVASFPNDAIDLRVQRGLGPPEPASRKVPFGREIYIEQDDFMLEPVKGYKRLSPGQEVRLRRAYVVRCTDVVQDAQGNVVEVHCTYDPATTGGDTPDGRKVPGTIHWVPCAQALRAEVRLYDRLFTVARPDAEKERDYKELLNPESLVTVQAALEPGLRDAKVGERFQFERQGYFYVDPDSTPGQPVFNRITELRNRWEGKKK
ncbi:MAG: glutamine--tRNA ligase/YqeY domain fusion protein [Candidatus Eremiobacterota bacterium]